MGTAQAAGLCANLPSEFQKGCQLFSDWGWTTGNPDAEYHVVDCPAAFKSYVADQFNADGVVSEDTVSTTTGSETSTTGLPETTIATTTASNADGACFISNCGCPDDFKQNWCNVQDHQLMDSFCKANQQNCETCTGSWCPYDGPGGSLTTTTQESTLETSSTSILTTTSTTTTTPIGDSCGYMPTKCENRITRAYNEKLSKTYKQFEAITGVSQNDATFEDVQLYWLCKGKSANKCAGMELPCGCSSPPCVCPGDETTTTSVTTEASTTTVASTTETSTASPTSTSTTSTGSTSTTTTEASTSTSTQTAQTCALAACGCSQTGQSWCNDSNSWLATDWCHASESNCQACTGVWCEGTSA